LPSHAPQLQSTESRVATLRDAKQRLASRLTRVKFEYSDPSANFDRSRVKGLVAQLVQVKDMAAATALEVTAGGNGFIFSSLKIFILFTCFFSLSSHSLRPPSPNISML
jgi:hypothetical protein